MSHKPKGFINFSERQLRGLSSKFIPIQFYIPSFEKSDVALRVCI
jgi:hypothetical protein